MTGFPRIIGHALLASAFFFFLPRYVLGESFESSATWALAGGGAAALLAWLQQRRGDGS